MNAGKRVEHWGGEKGGTAYISFTSLGSNLGATMAAAISEVIYEHI